eukprot:CAMPEP_0194519990 /NCGR_PEP_ID=MMETSP0253-20130528/53828_1 /TAXON_ID=2966 /ORGANISM="Noctiluca scintillans" /LENGTH=94 /DNA_ID=CAMNT_0039364179 /DNA_START=964 /DNA_END=1249 /DNA_ORIENTATION=-
MTRDRRTRLHVGVLMTWQHMLVQWSTRSTDRLIQRGASSAWWRCSVSNGIDEKVAAMGVLNTEGAAMATNEEETAARGTDVERLPPPGGTLDHV